MPDDLRYGWDIDSYFLYDLPAGVSGVKRITRRDRIFYCGHSMGGILGYGYAGIHDDFEGLITIGAPADLGRGFWPLRVLALYGPLLGLTIDAALTLLNTRRKLSHRAQVALYRALSLLEVKAAEQLAPGRAPRELSYRYVPVDTWLKLAARLLDKAEGHALFEALAEKLNWLANPDRVSAADIKWLLREGGAREPRKVAKAKDGDR